jgi:hypothetical protein
VPVNGACLPKGARLVGLVKWWRAVSATAEKWEADIDAKAPGWEATADATAAGWEVTANAKVAEVHATVKKATKDGGRLHRRDLDHWDALRCASEVALAARSRPRRGPGPDGCVAGPLDFLFPVWLVLVSLALLFARRRRGEARTKSAP